jgi:WD40 repeat protein
MNIFISYRSLDRETIRSLVRDLEDVGHHVWSDMQLSGGQDWWERVLDGIRESDLFVFGLTQSWLESNACLHEFAYATALNKNRLPVQLNQMPIEEIPPQVRRLQIVSYENENERAFRELQRAINQMPPPAPLPDELPDPPRSPGDELEVVDQQLRQLRLERDAQAAMVLELKRALRQRHSADKARQLLSALRKHPDTSETLAVSIDEALLTSSNKNPQEMVGIDILAELPEQPEIPVMPVIDETNLTQLDVCITFDDHTDTVYAVAFSPDGAMLASASGDKSLRMYALHDGEPLALLRGHHAAVRDLTFNPTGTFIASASADNTVRLWGIRQDRNIHPLEASDDWVLRVAYSPRGDVLAAASVNELTTLWDPANQGQLGALGGHGDWVSGLAFSPDGTTLATASYDGTIRFWNVTRRRRMNIIANGGMIEDIAFAPSGTALAAAMQDGSVRLWSVAKQTEIGLLNGHDHAVYRVAFSPDGNLLATVGADGKLCLWNTANFKRCATYDAHEGTAWGVAFSPDGGLLATAGDDAVIRVWGVPD